MKNIYSYNEYGELRIRRGNVEVEWVNLGEGISEDYDPNDTEDENLLRFDISLIENGGIVPVNDASYCTLVSVNEKQEIKKEKLEMIMDEVYEELQQNHPIKKLCERLSWI